MIAYVFCPFSLAFTYIKRHIRIKPNITINIIIDYYVYRYIRLDTNMPFYVGKGKGKRAKNVRNHNKLCKNIAKKHDLNIEFIMENLTEDQAFVKEKEFIKIHNTKYPNG